MGSEVQQGVVNVEGAWTVSDLYKVYLASRFRRQNMLRNVRTQLQQDVIVTSTWLDQSTALTNKEKLISPRSARIAHADLRDIRRSDALLLFCTRDLMGAWIEVGYAFGLKKPVFGIIDYALGPIERRSVFESLIIWCRDTDDFLLQLCKVMAVR